MLDTVIASALKRRLDKRVHFRKRVSAEEQRAQKYSVQPELMKRYQIYSVNVHRMMMSKISTFDGTKFYYQQVICLQM